MYYQRIQAALKEFGLNFGIAFQIVGDCRDIVSEKRCLADAWVRLNVTSLDSEQAFMVIAKPVKQAVAQFVVNCPAVESFWR